MTDEKTGDEMRAVLLAAAGGPEQMRLGTAPRPVPGDGEVLVRVHATALNRADILQREGRYPPPPGASPLMGLEVAGEIVAVGGSCHRWSVDDRVCALLPGGGYAQYVAVPCDMAMAVPKGMTFEEAAAIPEVFLTAYQALYRYGGLVSGHHVLIHAGGSGVGTAAIQLVREAGATPFVTASGPKHDACRALGAALAIDYRTEAFDDRVLDATDGCGVDVIIDFIGAPYLKPNVRSLAVDGRIIILATLGGSVVERFDLRALFGKRGQLFTSTLRSRDLRYKISLTRDFESYAMPRFAEGHLVPVIDRVYDWADVAQAHRRMEANANVGKIVLRVT